MAKLRKLNPQAARTEPLHRLSRLVSRGQFAKPLVAGMTMKQFLSALPSTLAARDLLELAEQIALARHAGRSVLLMSGAHALKVGLGPLICQMIREGLITAVATNGAALVHDFELAFAGRTSEDVGAGLSDGRFGMAEETGAFLNEAAAMAAGKNIGFGEAAGQLMVEQRLRYRQASVFATAYEHGISATVHVAIGTDIVHMHPRADGAAIGKATMTDFHRLAEVASGLSRGVVLNLGSAVIMPEVFVKALNLARNLGARVANFTAADMDFIRHYRPRVNVLERPTATGGRAIALTGHHEIMLPLLAAAVLEKVALREGRKLDKLD